MGKGDTMKQKLIEFIRFGFVGGAMTVLSFALYYVFAEFFLMHYLLANIVSYTIAVVLSYFLNVRFSFRVEIQDKKENLVKLIRYFIMKLAFLGVDSIFLFVMVQWIGIGQYLSKIITTIVLTIFSFAVTRMIVVKE